MMALNTRTEQLICLFLKEGPKETAQERGQLSKFSKPASSPTADAAAACLKAEILLSVVARIACVVFMLCSYV